MKEPVHPKRPLFAEADRENDESRSDRDLVITRREFVAGVSAAAAVAVAAGAKPGIAVAAGNATPIYRIHPAIGVARVGNLDPDVGFIVDPEIPGQRATDGLSGATVTNYKVNGLIKPQAARFRIYQYEYDAHGRLAPTREVLPQAATPGVPFVKDITWNVHLANRKASFYQEDGPVGESLPAGPLRNPTVANRASLENDFGPRSIAGSLALPQPFTPDTGGSYSVRSVRATNGQTLIDYLGPLRTDEQGRLLVFGGRGRSASNVSPPQPLTHWSNNDHWFDDMSDGPVSAIVTLDDGYGNLTQVPMDTAGHAWVLVTPPDFSPGLQAAVSLYDLLYDMAVRQLTIPANNALYADGGPLARLNVLNAAWRQWQTNPNPAGFEFGTYLPDYQSEIWPIVLNAVNYVYTTGPVNFKHSAMLTDPLGDPSAAAAKDRKVFMSYIRAPEAAATAVNGPATMPRLFGDHWEVGNFGASTGSRTQGPRAVPKYQRFQALTATQYGLLRIWETGNFIPPSGTAPTDTAITPHGLDRANLENCIGGAFYPGIECRWQIRNPALFIEPFRLNPNATSQYRLPNGAPEGTPIQAGHFSRQMALPWHADFNDCSKWGDLTWWPTARPDDVFLNVTDKLNQRVPWMRPDAKKWPSGKQQRFL